MSWRRVRVRVAAGFALALVVAAGVLAVLVFADGGRGDGLEAFSECIASEHFLVAERHGRHENVLVTIRDRSADGVVAEVTAARSKQTLGQGAAARDGRYLMSTASPEGRDASAIEHCWDGVFPIATNS